MSPFLRKDKKKKVRVLLSPLQKQLFLGFIVMLCVGLLLTAIWHVTRIETFLIQNVKVIGGQTIPHAAIEEKVNTALSGTYFALIPKRFAPLYPKSGITQNIRTINRVKNIHIEKEGTSVTVVFDEHIPFALWCETPQSSSCLFIDRTGYAFAEAPTLEGSAFIRYVDDKEKPQVGVSGFHSQFMRDTELFVSLLQDNLSLYATHIYKVGDYDVEYTISGGGTIKISQSIPMQESFENLETILLSEEFKHITPGSFQYIDLRFGEKIFVNEEIVTPETEAATSSEEHMR